MKVLSCGIIPLRNENGTWLVLLVQLYARHWGFPKGHLEQEEEPKDAAIRELYEETGLTVNRFLSDEIFTESYSFFHQGKRIDKQVIYFLAEVAGELRLQKEEIKDAKWVPLVEAAEHVTFPAGKEICKRVLELIPPIANTSP